MATWTTIGIRRWWTRSRNAKVILFESAEVGLSSGTTPRNVTAMARDAIAFVAALILKEIDLLGYLDRIHDILQFT